MTPPLGSFRGRAWFIEDGSQISNRHILDLHVREGSSAEYHNENNVRDLAPIYEHKQCGNLFNKIDIWHADIMEYKS